jgi:hypothetical protein
VKRESGAYDLAILDREQRFEALIVRVKARGRVIPPIHLNDDAEENGNRRQRRGGFNYRGSS